MTVARQVLKRYQPAPGVWPTEHLPEKLAAARREVRRAPRARGGGQWPRRTTPSRSEPVSDDPGRRTSSDDEPHAGLVDLERLRRFIDEHDLPGAGEPVEATFITGGASNELFEIRRGGHRMALRRPPRSCPAGRNETMLREYRLLAALADTDVPHARALAVCDDPDAHGGLLLSDGVRRRLVPHGRWGLARALRRRPRGPAGPGLRAGRRHRQAVPGGLAGPGPRGLRPARRLPRAPGRPMDEPSGRRPVPRHPRARRRRRRGCGPISPAPTSPGSCTATTNSPT